MIPEPNSARLKQAIDRNQNVDTQLVILPGLNHLLQTSKSGLPEEYEEIEETISPAALSTIRQWAESHGLIDK